MLIDLYGILFHEGEVKKLDIPLEMTTYSSKLGDYPIAEKHELKLCFTNTGNKIIRLESELDVLFNLSCDRCLTTVPTQVKADSIRELNFGEVSPDADETLEDMSFIDGTTFDTERYAYCEILENFPMKVLCKTDCKGICKVCGMNLNLGTCDCDRQVLDPRMAQIRDIFQQFNK